MRYGHVPRLTSAHVSWRLRRYVSFSLRGRRVYPRRKLSSHPRALLSLRLVMQPPSDIGDDLSTVQAWRLATAPIPPSLACQI